MGYGKTYKTKWLEDLSGNQGTANQVLISTSSGIAWATASTIIGGPYLPLSGGTMTGNTTHGDNVRSLYGASSDLQVYHDGSNSYVRDVGAGRLWIDSNGEGVSIISDGSGSTPMAHFYKDGAVELFHNNSKKFETTNDGIQVTGEIRTADYIVHTGDSDTYFGFATDNEFKLVVGGTNKFAADTNAAYMYYQGNVKLQTSNTGVTVTGDITGGSAFSIRSEYSNRGRIDLSSATGSGANQISMLTDGNARLVISKTGNVGIGTTSPLAKTHISASGNLAIPGLDATLGTATSLAIGNNGGTVVLAAGVSNTNVSWLQGRQGTGTGNAFNISLNPLGGNVGIGTTSPASKLHIVGADGTYQTRIGHSTQSLYLTVDGTNVDYKSSGSSAGSHSFSTGNTERVRIDSSGNVGIGTTSPSEKLEVNGNVKVTGAGGITIASFAPELNLTANNSGSSTVNFGDTSNVNIARIYYNHSSNYMHFKINDAERMRINSSGNVGIGTTNPTEKLEVSGNVKLGDNNKLLLGTSSDLQVYHNGSDSFSENYTGNLTFRQRQDNGKIIFQSDNGSGGITEYLTLDGSNTHAYFSNPGNVGIGTSSPSEKLEVDGIIKVVHTDDSYATYRGNGVFFNRAENYIAPLADNTSTLNIGYNGAKWGNIEINGAFIKFENGPNEFMRIASSGNVGIGTTSPSSILHVKGSTNSAEVNIDTDDNALGDNASIKFNGARAQVGWIDAAVTLTDGGGNKDIKLKVNTGSIFLQTNNTNRLTVADGGNVGIGTTSPSASSLLDVTSTTKGVLLPRMTTTQVNAISSPANGLTVYNTTLNTLCFYNGTSWQKVTSANM